MIRYITFSIFILSFFGCKEPKQSGNTQIPGQTEVEVCSNTGIVNTADTVGCLKCAYLSSESTERVFTVKDKNGTSIKFNFNSTDENRLNLTSVKTGACIEVCYRVQILREEGEEVNRNYFAKSLNRL